MEPYYAAAALAVGAAALTAGPPAYPVSGGPQVLLLDTMRIVEGTVDRVGDMLLVRRGGAVTEIPVGRVIFAGDSHAAVQQFLAGRAAAAGGTKPGPDADPVFPTRVQPILTNLCAACHARPNHPGGFKLARVPAGYADPEAAAANARTAARFLAPGDPAAGPLLTKAVTAHGGQRVPALPGRSHPAFRTLAAWAAGVVPTAPNAVAPPAAAAGLADPFDPAAFNRGK